MNQQNSSPVYLIKDLVQKTGLSADTIRFYEKKNLLEPSFRGDNNYRYYQDEALKRLIFIKRCRALDISLKEIEYLIQLEQNPQQDCSAVNQLIDEHLKQVEQKIVELKKFQIQLQQLRQSCATLSTIDDCQILRQLEAETSDE
ncbi:MULTISPECIES: Cd(II)/Pb(II)-responsive transcriptional regulator [unclassified Acinetobacter]|uniref:Cd(II)/Pb(II)-responsive transcriptional regulator n=1 Tax=unclassified Acinetobacter TaxID=196816 RepID=UPI000DA64F42|nr:MULTISPECIES: Cd(II)/Pb(II)-responsive transcriptional regulator [unclassified Acinetobacter]RGD93675.1 Cd(II)/Pb(II)-responsive transcriptional regulator [Acinetobacter sp. SWAC57]